MFVAFLPIARNSDSHDEVQNLRLTPSNYGQTLRHRGIYPFHEGSIPGDRALLVQTLSFQPAIPWQVALLQSVPPLHRFA